MESAVIIKVLGFDFDGTLARILDGKTASDIIEKKLEPYELADDDVPPKVEQSIIEQVIDEHASILVEGILKDKLLEAIQNNYQIAIISCGRYPYAATYFLKKIIGLEEDSIAKIHLEFKCPLTNEGKVIGVERVLTKICKTKRLQTVNFQLAYFEDEEKKAAAVKQAFGASVVVSIATADGKHIDDLNNIETTFANLAPSKFTVNQPSLVSQPGSKSRARSRLHHAHSISTVSQPAFDKDEGDASTSRAKKGLSRSFSMFEDISTASPLTGSKRKLDAKTPSPKRPCNTPSSPGLTEPFGNLGLYTPANFFVAIQPIPAGMASDSCRSPQQFDGSIENYAPPLTPQN